MSDIVGRGLINSNMIELLVSQIQLSMNVLEQLMQTLGNWRYSAYLTSNMLCYILMVVTRLPMKNKKKKI